MYALNEVKLIGRVGKQPEIRTTQTGTAVASFSIATTEKWKDKSGQTQEKTEWHNVVAWGKQAEIIRDYLNKGDLFFVQGKLQTRQWQDKQNVTHYSTEVVMSDFVFLQKSKQAAPSGPAPAAPMPGAPIQMPKNMPEANTNSIAPATGTPEAVAAQQSADDELDDLPF